VRSLISEIRRAMSCTGGSVLPLSVSMTASSLRRGRAR
jgi:hypothetical protein